MTKLNFHKNTRAQVKKTICMVADCLATVQIHGRERERERERASYAMYWDICYCM